EDVGIANRLGAQARAERIANHAADAGICPAIGLESGRMVMGFHLEADVVRFVETHDAGVISEYAHAPIVLAERLANLVRCGKDRFLEHVLELALAVRSAIGDPAAERFVAAVLAPGLRDGFELDICGVAIERAEMLL